MPDTLFVGQTDPNLRNKARKNATLFTGYATFQNIHQIAELVVAHFDHCQLNVTVKSPHGTQIYEDVTFRSCTVTEYSSNMQLLISVNQQLPPYGLPKGVPLYAPKGSILTTHFQNDKEVNEASEWRRSGYSFHVTLLADRLIIRRNNDGEVTYTIDSFGEVIVKVDIGG